MIYFIQEPSTCNIKIGFAGDDAELRRKTLQIGNSSELTILLTIAGDKREEDKLHTFFAAHHVRGEFFRPSPDVIRFIAEHWKKGVLPGDPASNLTQPVEQNAVRMLMDLLSKHGPDAFSVHGPLGESVDDDIKTQMFWVWRLNKSDGMQRVWNTIEKHVSKLFEDHVADDIMATLDRRFDGVGDWFA